jgi:putative nucleotidyltransferase with HDIG domain
MANLAEAAAYSIGANAMLVRVGAYFHDVGKSYRPEFFIENQAGGENPHDKLLPYDSAKAIFQHVTEGVKLLRKAKVPEDIIEFVYSHHGTSLLEYFWYKNIELGNKENFRKKDFSYPGQKPTTKETAILMIVDAAEAAARTVDKPEKSKFESLLQRIVFSKMGQGQFDDSPLTMHDLRVIILTIADTLTSMYHERIKYPWQKNETDETGGTEQNREKKQTADNTDNNSNNNDDDDEKRDNNKESQDGSTREKEPVHKVVPIALPREISSSKPTLAPGPMPSSGSKNDETKETK